MTFALFFLPFIMIVFGLYRYDNIPKMDSPFGFKSKYAIINENAYIYANKKINDYYVRFYCVIYIFVSASEIIFTHYATKMSNNEKMLFYLFITLVEFLGFVIPIFLVNNDLKKRFHHDYNKR